MFPSLYVKGHKQYHKKPYGVCAKKIANICVMVIRDIKYLFLSKIWVNRVNFCVLIVPCDKNKDINVLKYPLCISDFIYMAVGTCWLGQGLLGYGSCHTNIWEFYYCLPQSAPPIFQRFALSCHANILELPTALIYQTCRGLFRNFDLQVLLLNTEFTLERVPLSKSQNFTGSAKPLLTRPLICLTLKKVKSLSSQSFIVKVGLFRAYEILE